MKEWAFGFLAALWLIGCALFVFAGIEAPRLRPRTWPWLVPLWPLMLLIEWAKSRQHEARLRRLKAEVWRR
jgi:hypothetical protein